MKQCLILLTLAIAATVFAEEPEITEQQRAAMKRAAEFRTFTTTNGVSITGRLVGYRENAGILELLTLDGSEKVELSTLSEDDQAYIQNWYAAFSTLDKKRLRITLNEETLKESTYKSEEWVLLPELNDRKAWRPKHQRDLPSGFGKCERTHYILIIENKSGNDLNDIIVEYCIYHKADIEAELTTGRFDEFTTGSSGISGGWIVTDREGLPDRTAIDTLTGLISIDQLGNKEEACFQTKQIFSPRDETQRAYHAENKFIVRELDCEVLGIRYRVYLPTPNGEYAMMEFADPKKLLEETEWPDEL